MKLSDYAKAQGVSYRTAWSWWKKGIIKGRQLPKGTILIETVITSFCARLYGMRRAKSKTEKLISELQSNGDNETC